MTQQHRHLIALTADIVAAYVSNNAVPMDQLNALVEGSYRALLDATTVASQGPTLVPAVPIKRSITPDHLLSLEDGRSYKSLKRHLAGRGMTPEDYRTKWGLPANYPMVAPNYAKRRSELARSIGLGRKRAAPPAPAPAAAPARKTRGPARKATTRS